MSLPVLTIEQMRAWEHATWSSGVIEDSVIARVGIALAALILRNTLPDDRVLLLVGKGNNGADARAARAHLAGRVVEVIDATDPRAALAPLNTALATRPALVVDGLFGIGLNRSLSGEWR